MKIRGHVDVGRDGEMASDPTDRALMVLHRTPAALTGHLRKKRAVGWTAEYSVALKSHFLLFHRKRAAHADDLPTVTTVTGGRRPCRVVDVAGATTLDDVKSLLPGARARGFVVVLSAGGSRIGGGGGRSLRLRARDAAIAGAWRDAIATAVAATPQWLDSAAFLDRGCIGEGAFGSVRRVRDAAPGGCEWALKMLPLAAGGWPAARVVEERIALERVGHHPHITGLHSAFISRGCVHAHAQTHACTARRVVFAAMLICVRACMTLCV